MATRISVQMEHNIRTHQTIEGVEDQQATEVEVEVEVEVMVLITILTVIFIAAIPNLPIKTSLAVIYINNMSDLWPHYPRLLS